MSGIAIYMEGGGDGKENRAALRQGMDTFLQPLKDEARKKSLHWNLACCGSRDETFKRFRDAVNSSADAVNVLLIDAEGPVSQSPRRHLQDRDRWDLSSIDEDTVHLIVQTMEAWIVADSETLKRYYGQDFKENKLPKAADLETVPKPTIKRSLDEATKDTQKGRYHKIGHASDLLKRIDAEKVKARCCHCRRVFKALGRIVETA
ncbi:MAG: DUF4276 family protein [Gemmatimonadetes bacterium]|nr:DUF4276 family protein [Gemmatimonadota bacterium]